MLIIRCYIRYPFTKSEHGRSDSLLPQLCRLSRYIGIFNQSRNYHCPFAKRRQQHWRYGLAVIIDGYTTAGDSDDSGSDNPVPTPAANPSPTPVTDGMTLYGANCAGCHGALASTGKAGTTASRIQSAINGNVGNMGYLSTLSTSQIAVIASVLTTAAPPAPTDGPGLYAADCASCHGGLAKSDVRGESAREISKAISKNKGGMKSLSTLTSATITAIANALKK